MPKTKDIDDPNIINSSALVKYAVAGAETLPCLWLRGIVPANYIEVDTSKTPPTEPSITYVNPEFIDWNFQVFYGDASGGKYTKYQKLRRVGVGVVAVTDVSAELIFGLHTPLPGTVQTVARGELYALFLVVQRVTSNKVSFITDNKAVFDMYTNGIAQYR